jgi:leucyl aminopeptidase (aminopeptidase T)
MTGMNWLRFGIAATVLLSGTTATAQETSTRSVARNMVQAGMVKAGDKVLINGSMRDAALLEDIAIEAAKVGAHPLITISSDRLVRRSFDEVPPAFDNVMSPVDMLLTTNFDVQILVDVGETEGLLAGVPVARRTARAKAGEPITEAYFKRNIRLVNLGNGLYPTVSLSRRLGVPQPALASAFWKAASVTPSSLRTRGETLRRAFARDGVATITAPNGTNFSVRLKSKDGFVSDGAITADKVKQGSAAAATYLPAGELILPADNGSANGKIVLDRLVWDGRLIRGLTLTFEKGVLTAMTAENDMSALEARYESASGAKNRFGFIDIGLNDQTRLPVGSGRVVWTAPGSVVIGFGDNRGFGGDNQSDFTFIAQLGGATVTVDGKPVISAGRLR